MKAPTWTITIEIGMLLVGLFLLTEHVINPSQYGAGTFFVSEILIFCGLLLAFAEILRMDFRVAFAISVISIIFTVAVTALLFWFA